MYLLWDVVATMNQGMNVKVLPGKGLFHTILFPGSNHSSCSTVKQKIGVWSKYISFMFKKQLPDSYILFNFFIFSRETRVS